MSDNQLTAKWLGWGSESATNLRATDGWDDRLADNRRSTDTELVEVMTQAMPDGTPDAAYVRGTGGAVHAGARKRHFRGGTGVVAVWPSRSSGRGRKRQCRLHSRSLPSYARRY